MGRFDMRRVRDILKEIEDKKLFLKQLEGVYKTSINSVQKKRVLREVRDIKISLRKLKTVLDLYRGIEGAGEAPLDEEERVFSILSMIKVLKFSEFSRDKEMVAIISYADFFEKNYLPILSEYYIKLDYNSSLKRDTFYSRYMEIKKLLKEYNYEIEVHTRTEYDSIASYKDKSNVYKIRQRYLLSLDAYFKNLKSFTETLIGNYMSGGSIIMNPLDKISLSEFENDRRLDGYTVIDALSEMYTFYNEFTRFLGMPKI